MAGDTNQVSYAQSHAATCSSLTVQQCVVAFSGYADEIAFNSDIANLAVTGGISTAMLTVPLAVAALPEGLAALGACATNPLCLSNVSVGVGEATLGLTGAASGQTFFAAGSAVVVTGGKFILQNGDQIIGVFADFGNLYRPISQHVDDAGRFLVKSANGATGYLDNAHSFVHVPATNRTFDFTTNGAGNDLRRFTTLDGIDVRINSGHAYNRTHAGGDVSQIGTMDEIENAILREITANSRLGSLPSRTTQTHTVQVNGQTVGYSLADTPFGANINYYPVIE